MRLGIMQPYWFPYLGYFQLIHAVERFVIYDDVQWIKGGWINRNRILVRGQPRYITLPVRRDASLVSINQRTLSPEHEREKHKIIQQIGFAYSGAPHFNDVMPLVHECISSKETHVSPFVVNTLRACCAYLGIATPFILSSKLAKNAELRGQDKVLDINHLLGATHYVNSIGGVELYDKEAFARKGIQLSFLKTGAVAYEQQAAGEFVPNLSIIDVMMFNDRQKCRALVESYELV
jgi:WbqC-like protein family